MSHISGIRNLRELYTQKHSDKLEQGSPAAASDGGNMCQTFGSGQFHQLNNINQIRSNNSMIASNRGKYSPAIAQMKSSKLPASSSSTPSSSLMNSRKQSPQAKLSQINGSLVYDNSSLIFNAQHPLQNQSSLHQQKPNLQQSYLTQSPLQHQLPINKGSSSLQAPGQFSANFKSQNSFIPSISKQSQRPKGNSFHAPQNLFNSLQQNQQLQVQQHNQAGQIPSHTPGVSPRSIINLSRSSSRDPSFQQSPDANKNIQTSLRQQQNVSSQSKVQVPLNQSRIQYQGGYQSGYHLSQSAVANSNSGFSRSSSKHEFSVDKTSLLESQRDRSIALNKGGLQNSNSPQSNSALLINTNRQTNKFSVLPSESAVLAEKYKGAPFLNYVFLNNYQSSDLISPKRSSNGSSRAESRNQSIQIDEQDSQEIQTVQPELCKGGFGKVWKVDSKKTKKVYAMKEMSKSKIITKRSVNSVISERQLLSQLKHPFLVNMNFAFQDRDTLYLGMDLVTGGDLRFHIGKMRRFSETQTRFFIACMMLCLEYLHVNNIIHRDIKPENLVIDEIGYVRVTDLGIARVWKPDNSQDTSGTPGYMAPEVMCRQNHDIAVDYFAVGVIGYEFMMGRRPYLGRSRKEIRDQILSKQIQIKKHEIPEGWSIEAADFINRMIQRKPINRLGINGPEEVKSHPWLKNFPWQKLLNKEIESPFIPMSIEENVEYRQQISLDDRDTNEDLEQQNALLLRRNSVQNLFAGYNFEHQPIAVIGTKRLASLGGRTESTAATHNTKDTHSDRITGPTSLQRYLNNSNSESGNTNTPQSNSSLHRSSLNKQDDDH